MASHLEQLVAEYLEWQGFLIRRNVRVGKRPKGGWEMELDIIGYHPIMNRLVHYEPSLDADSWSKKEERYTKKFGAGRQYITSQIFKWISSDCKLEQFAIFISRSKTHSEIAGGKIIAMDDFVREVIDQVSASGKMQQNAIPETFPLLRTIQLVSCGYSRKP